MGRVAKEIDVDEVRKKYNEIGNIKKLASIFHVSNTRMIKIIDDNQINKKCVGNKINLDKKIINEIINDYVKNLFTINELCEKYGLKTDKMTDVLKTNGITPKKWNGHYKKMLVPKTKYIKSLINELEKRKIEYDLNFKINATDKVSLKIGDTLIDLYKNKTLLPNKKYQSRFKILEKKERLLLRGYRYIPIFEDEYKDKPQITTLKILHIIGCNDNSEKIGGRKCCVREIDSGDAEKFFNNNHIQGFVGSSIHFGAFYNEKMIGAMSFLNEGIGKWNLTRFATLNGYICQGVGGKLFKHFVNLYNPCEIRSFADSRWTLNHTDNIYTKLGFNFEYKTPPSYYYLSNKKYNRIRRERCRKQILHKKYGFPLTMTEREMTKELGYDRIWDCGLFKYVWTKNEQPS